VAEAEQYDVIIVGGGSAGCVLAARLTEKSGRRVLLLEAGGSDLPAEVATPQAWPALFESSADWGTSTQPQQFTGTPHRWVRGKGLGGSSLINAMTFVRGHASSYDAWSQLGVEGWSFEELLPCFRASEHAVGRDPRLRGQHGPLQVAAAEPLSPFAAAVADAAAEAGHPRPGDASGGHDLGVGPSDMNIVDGRRQSVADAYLPGDRPRHGLTIIQGALASRLVITGGRCVAVVYEVDGAEDQARVRDNGEVHVAAGCIGSPQLLMRSGIGPADHLREHGIAVVADLPGVGANFQDHPMAGITWSARQPLPATRYQHSEVHGLLHSGLGDEAAGPDLQVLSVDLPWTPPGVQPPRHGYSINVSLMCPRSRGSVRLASAATEDMPLVDPAYLTEQADIDAMVAGLRVVRTIGAGRALDPWRDEEFLPGPEARTDEALVRHLRAVTGPYWHGVGTCAMGRGPAGVVDDRLRVRGIEGLRVVDASVIPTIPSANTNATVVAIAERAATFALRGGGS
jgi:choline dehydrogenase